MSPVNVSNIIKVILSAKSQATNLLRYSVDGGKTINEIDKNMTIHAAIGGILLHIGGSFEVGQTIYNIDAKRSLLPFVDKTNYAKLNGVKCKQGLHFHNETDLSEVTKKGVTISYGMHNPVDGQMILFYADIKL